MLSFNYIYKLIFEIIIGSTSKYNSQNNNEYVNYALVSKSFFQIVSNVISEKINRDNSCFRFHSLIESIPPSLLSEIQNKNNQQQQQQQSSSSSFKIIKLKDSIYTIIYQVKDDQKENEKEFKILLNICQLYNKVYIGAKDCRSSDYLLEHFDQLPNNVELSLYYTSEYFTLIYNSGSDCNNKIGKIEFSRPGLESLHEILSLDIPPKHIHYSMASFIGVHNCEIEFEFQSTSTQKINVDYLVFPAAAVSKSSSQFGLTSKLEKLTFGTNFKSLLNNQQDAQYIINKLSDDPTLKAIKLLGNNTLGHDYIYIVRSILINQKSINRVNLEFKNKINDLILDSLYLNRSIKDIFIVDHLANVSKLVCKVFLNSNNTIKNLYVSTSQYSLSWLSLFIDPGYKVQFSKLYSITLNVQSINSFNIIKSFVKKNWDQFSIKEFILYYTESNQIPSDINPTLISINNKHGSILNIIKYITTTKNK